jgi:hypothetical protein
MLADDQRTAVKEGLDGVECLHEDMNPRSNHHGGGPRNPDALSRRERSTRRRTGKCQKAAMT